MRNKRDLTEYSIEELERILAIRRRQERQKRLTRMKSQGRVVTVAPEEPRPRRAQPAPTVPAPVRPEAEVKPKVSAISTESFTLDTLESMLQGGAPAPSRSTPVAPSDTVPASPAPSTAAYDDTYDDDENIDDELLYLEDEDRTETKPAPRKLFDRLLLLIEVAAVLGLIAIVSLTFAEMTKLQQESALIQAEGEALRRTGIPTAAPTSVIQLAKLEDYLLPGGHVIDSSGRAVLNTNEIFEAVPAHLQASVMSQAYSIDFIRPPRTSETALQVFIPSLDIDATIVQGTDWEALKQGVGQVLNGANPTDDDSNVSLAAHNDIYGALFEHLDQLTEGDLIQLQTENQLFNYYVTHWEIVDPHEIRVLESQGVPMVTLISCYPYGVNNKRYIVYAVREDAYRSQL